MMRWAQQGWERLSLYLPVLLMGLLALGTWWLVRNAPAPLAASQSATAPDQPDYSMKNFAVKSFDATGRLQSEVMGETARHYPGTDTLEIDQFLYGCFASLCILHHFDDVGKHCFFAHFYRPEPEAAFLVNRSCKYFFVFFFQYRYRLTA
jgi:hypothetical protein